MVLTWSRRFSCGAGWNRILCVPDFIQGWRDARSVQDFILLYMRRILTNSDNSEPLVKIYWGGKGGEKQKVSERFSFSNVNYNLRSGSQFHQPSANTVWNGQETTSYLGPKIWNMVPEEMKQKIIFICFQKRN